MMSVCEEEAKIKNRHNLNLLVAVTIYCEELNRSMHHHKRMKKECWGGGGGLGQCTPFKQPTTLAGAHTSSFYELLGLTPCPRDMPAVTTDVSHEVLAANQVGWCFMRINDKSKHHADAKAVAAMLKQAKQRPLDKFVTAAKQQRWMECSQEYWISLSSSAQLWCNTNSSGLTYTRFTFELPLWTSK